MKAPSFQKVTLFLRYKIFNRDVINLRFVSLKMLLTTVIEEELTSKVLFRKDSFFAAQ